MLMTVVRAQGSTPREAGAMMLLAPGDQAGAAGSPRADGMLADEGGAIMGTIGGGQFEHIAMDDARRSLRERRSGLERYVLGAEAEQCCGGVLEVFFQYTAPAVNVVIFGAGHVAAHVAPLLVSAPVRTVIVDDRAEWNSAARFGAAARVLDWSAGVALCRREGARAVAFVMTCSHRTDEHLVRGLLSDDAPGSVPAFVGLIGSRSKRACLFGRLVAGGIEPERVERVRCPIGVGDTGKEPAALAISIAAQALIEAKKIRDAEAGSARAVSTAKSCALHTRDADAGA